MCTYIAGEGAFAWQQHRQRSINETDEHRYDSQVVMWLACRRAATGELDAKAERRQRLKEIVERQRAMGLDKEAGTSFLLQDEGGGGGRFQGGRGGERGRGRFKDFGAGKPVGTLGTCCLHSCGGQHASLGA